MKQCQKCGRFFEDTAFYCPECGEELKAYAQAPQMTAQTTQPSQKKSTMSAFLEQATEKTRELDNSGNVLTRWLPTILAVVGLIVCWNWAATLGACLAAIGGLYGFGSVNKANKIISVSIAVICVLLAIFTIIVG